MTPVVLAALVACSPPLPAVDGGAAPFDSGTPVPDGGVPPPDGGSPDGAADSGHPAQDAGTDGGAVVVGGCPRVLLGRSLPAEFKGDTTTLTNLVTSRRLEWTDAPDDSLEFTAPEAGKYWIEFSSTAPSLDACAYDYNTLGTNGFPFTRASCPAPGAIGEINGFFTGNDPKYPLTLKEGQSIVIFVSAPYWAAVKSAPYTLRVHRLP